MSVAAIGAERKSALLSYGFRPFFLLGAVYSALSILVWLPVYFGDMTVPTAFTPRDWHIHEMLYGYLTAIIAGFLLTAIPNWTGRLPLRGTPLLVLVLIWIAGRVAVGLSGLIGARVAAVVDASFLIVLAAAVAREIIAGRNWRNMIVLTPLAVLACGNVAFHIEAMSSSADMSVKIGVVAVLTLIMVIGGRVVPSFTRNWLARQGAGRLPQPFNRYDTMSIVMSVLALLLWMVLSTGAVVGIALIGAALLQSVRLARWAGERTLTDRLVLILHVGYAFVPLGFVLSGLAAFDFVPPSAGLHAWMSGAAGTMTLAIMTRATLGHTGRALVAGPMTQAIYGFVIAASLARIAAALLPDFDPALLYVAAAAWVTAYGLFVWSFGPMLLKPKL
jgi:uncharacterized protein involved in response to NO